MPALRDGVDLYRKSTVSFVDALVIATGRRLGLSIMSFDLDLKPAAAYAASGAVEK